MDNRVLQILLHISIYSVRRLLLELLSPHLRVVTLHVYDLYIIYIIKKSGDIYLLFTIDLAEREGNI